MSVSERLPHPRELLTVGPHAEAHWVALRAGISVAVPLGVLTASGNAGWSVYAAFGAFTAIYGRGEGYRRRAHTQIAAAMTLVAAIVAGTSIAALVEPGSTARWAIVAASALTAVIGSLVADAVGWRPAGPMFAVFAISTCAAVPADLSDVTVAFVLAAGSAGFSVLIGLSGGISAHRRARDRATSPPSGLRRLVDEPAVRRHALRYGLAVLVAGSVATVAGIGHPSWAMVAAVVPLSVSDTPGQLLRASHRVVGTALGLVVAAGLLALDLAGGGLVLVIVTLQVITEMLVVRNYGLAMLAITPLALLMNMLVGTTSSGVLLRDRAVETLIGALIGCGVAVASRGSTPPRLTRSPAPIGDLRTLA